MYSKGTYEYIGAALHSYIIVSNRILQLGGCAGRQRVLKSLAVE